MTIETQSLVPNAARFNLRDYGGYPTTSGGRLRKGLLWRSGQLDRAGAQEDQLLRRLGVEAVVDLRSAGEIAAEQSCAYAGFSGRILIADSEDGVIPHAIDAMVRLPTPEAAAAKLEGTYRLLPTSGRFRQALRLYIGALAEAEGASLIHCFAGKDRTGLAVALAQLALGVHRDDVFAEYLLTNAAGEERIAASLAMLKLPSGVEINPAVLRELMAVRAEYLAAALEVIEGQSESPVTWVLQVAGLDLADLDRLRERYAA